MALSQLLSSSIEAFKEEQKSEHSEIESDKMTRSELANEITEQVDLAIKEKVNELKQNVKDYKMRLSTQPEYAKVLAFQTEKIQYEHNLDEFWEFKESVNALVNKDRKILRGFALDDKEKLEWQDPNVANIMINIEKLVMEASLLRKQMSLARAKDKDPKSFL